MKPFDTSFNFEDKTLIATATYDTKTDSFQLVVKDGEAVIDSGTWDRAYDSDGFENAELGEAVADQMVEQWYKDRWEVTLPVFEAGGELSPGAVDRLGGVPIGVTVDRWPRMTVGTIDEPMNHIVTVSKAHFAEGLPQGAAAVALFVWNPDDNEAFEPDTLGTRVVFLSEAQLAAGETSERPEGYDASREREGVALVVKTKTDTFAELGFDHVGLPISWLQSPEGQDEAGRFLFQFTEDLIDINLGDTGSMYVFENAAWWQCF